MGLNTSNIWSPLHPFPSPFLLGDLVNANPDHVWTTGPVSYGSGHGTVAVLLTWFCYQLIAKPGNKAAAVSRPDPYTITALQDGMPDYYLSELQWLIY